MSSLEIISFKKSIEDFIASQKLPAEVKRMVVKEIYEDVTAEAAREAMREIKEEEDKHV